MSLANKLVLDERHGDDKEMFTLHTMWLVKSSQMSIKVGQKWFISIEKLEILTTLQKLPKNVVDLGKLIVAKGFEKLPKVQ